MIHVLLFLIISNLNLLAFEKFFYDFTVRTNYSQYFNSSNNAEKIKPQKHYTTDGYYVEVSSSIIGDYVYYSFLIEKMMCLIFFQGLM